jgi:(1->4)-alpha-D-glucan 1-alpha-D-glucosylmutase
VVAYDRGAESPGALTIATRLPKRLARDGGWRDTVIELPARSRDELTGATYDAGAVELATLLEQYPVALLVPVD